MTPRPKLTSHITDRYMLTCKTGNGDNSTGHSESYTITFDGTTSWHVVIKKTKTKQNSNLFTSLLLDQTWQIIRNWRQTDTQVKDGHLTGNTAEHRFRYCLQGAGLSLQPVFYYYRFTLMDICHSYCWHASWASNLAFSRIISLFFWNSNPPSDTSCYRTHHTFRLSTTHRLC